MRRRGVSIVGSIAREIENMKKSNCKLSFKNKEKEVFESGPLWFSFASDITLRPVITVLERTAKKLEIPKVSFTIF